MFVDPGDVPEGVITKEEYEARPELLKLDLKLAIKVNNVYRAEAKAARDELERQRLEELRVAVNKHGMDRYDVARALATAACLPLDLIFLVNSGHGAGPMLSCAVNKSMEEWALQKKAETYGYDEGGAPIQYAEMIREEGDELIEYAEVRG